LDIVLTFQLVVAIVIALFVAYNVFHYVLFLLVTQPKDASKVGRELNQFEQRQLIEWTPQPIDFLKHDDEKRTYDDVFGTYRDEQANYSTCVFPRVAFSRPYEAEYVLLKLKDGMRLLDLGCGSGAAAYYLASRRDIEIVCVTNSPVQADICRRKFAKLGGRGQVIVTDFDSLDLPSESFDAIYALESIGYTKNLDAWLARCWRMLKPGGSLLIRSPGSLDHCRRKEDYLSVTVFFDNWRYNFVGANLLVYKMRRLGFNPIRYRRLPFWAWGLTWNFIQHLVLWKYRLKMRTFVELERIIWRTSKVFVFGNPYNTVLATKPEAASCSRQDQRKIVIILSDRSREIIRLLKSYTGNATAPPEVRRRPLGRCSAGVVLRNHFRLGGTSIIRPIGEPTSAFGSKAENICSFRAFPLLTQAV
jgi:SAM-dependent methyltransferase